MQVTRALALMLVSLVVAACGQSKVKPSAAVARIGSETITAADLDGRVAAELQQLQEQYQKQAYQAKRRALDEMVQRRLLETKAKQVGASSPEELIQTEVASRVSEPTDSEIRSVYDQAVASGQDLPALDKVRAEIVRFLKQQKQQTELKTYFERLKVEQGAEILLTPYLPPRKVVEAKGPSKGPSDAPITIVEFADFQCPYCRKTQQTLADLFAAYPGKIRLVARDFPLPIHPLAPKAAEASHCAGDQGKYWEARARLFAPDAKLEVASLKQLARELSLDGERFDKCLDAGEKAKVVDEHKRAGEALNVTGTPAFFVNGRMLTGAQPIDEFKAIIDAELSNLARK